METKTTKPVTPIELFELGEDEVLETLDGIEADDVVRPARAAAEAGAHPQPQPKTQADQPKADTAQRAFAEPEPPKAAATEIEGVQFDTEDVLEGAMQTRNQRTGAVEVEQEALDEQENVESKGVLSMIAKNIKLVVGGIALAAVGLFMIPSSKVVAPVAQPVAVQAPAPTPAPTAQPGGLDIPAPGGPVATDNPALDIASMGSSPDDQSRLSAELDKDLQVIPAQEQTCSNPALTSYEQRQCSRYTAQMFFKCTEGAGRRWNVGVAGCEQI